MIRPTSLSRYITLARCLVLALGAGMGACMVWASASAQDASYDTAPPVKRVVEPIPAQTALDNIYRVSADRTPSGFVVPRFVSLKFGHVNGRTGPSREHPIAWQYQRRGLPLLVVAETEMWRKVRDMSGDEAWVRKPALSGAKFVVALRDMPLHAKPTPKSRKVAKTEATALLRLSECNAQDWCEVRADNGLKGWARKNDLWGAQTVR